VTAPSRLAMKWLDGKDFSQHLNKFVKPLLIKGAPSVIQDLKEFYGDELKIAMIEKLLFSYLEQMKANSTLEKGDKDEQDPTVMLWLLYFISHHYLFKKDVENALKYVNMAIEHTPTLLDLYTLKGKIMQIAGDRSTAAKLFEEARVLDQADRALNAIAACYQVKAG
jgi:tetratricopeptide (TPR) repeat protein